MSMYEEIILLKKIADYFKKTHKFSIAETINEEFKKEVANFPNFAEPEYVKDDLKTIFSKHIKLKKRQSEIRIEKSMLASRNGDNARNNRKSKKNRNSNLEINVNDAAIADSEVVTGNEDQQSILQVIDTNSEIIDRTNHEFKIPLTSTPIQENNENRNPFALYPDVSVIKVEELEKVQSEDEIDFLESDDDDVIITKYDASFHQSNYSAKIIPNDDGRFLSERMSQYEHNFIRPSQSVSSSSALSQLSETIKVEPYISNATETINQAELNYCQEGSIIQTELPDSNIIENVSQMVSNEHVEETLPEERTDIAPLDEDTTVRLTQGYNQTTEAQMAENDSQKTTLEDVGRNYDCISENLFTQDVEDVLDDDVIVVLEDSAPSIDAGDVIQVTEPTKTKGCEIATQCDESEIIQQTGVHRDMQLKRQLSESLENCNENKRQRLNSSINVDIDESVEEVQSIGDKSPENVPRQSEEGSVPSVQDVRPRKQRNRESSLSSLEMANEADVEIRVKNMKKTRQSIKPVVVFKNDKKMDITKRILLNDGWLLWPTSLLSGCLKHYTEEDFHLVLEQFESVDHSNLETRRDLLNCFLEQMFRNKLILRGYLSVKKTNLFMKTVTLSSEQFQLYEIDPIVYGDILWNKSAGPKTGRKMCAEAAPQNVKCLLNGELRFVEELIQRNTVATEDIDTGSDESDLGVDTIISGTEQNNIGMEENNEGAEENNIGTEENNKGMEENNIGMEENNEGAEENNIEMKTSIEESQENNIESDREDLLLLEQ